MNLKSKPENEIGAHHCTREEISHQISRLKQIQNGQLPVADIDWIVSSGVIALQFEWLLSCHDN